MIFETVFVQFETNFRTMCVLFFYVLLQNFEKHVGCVKIMLMRAYRCIHIQFIMDVNYM